MAGTLYVVATPIGNMEDITLRALRVLGAVPVIAAEDTRTAQRLLGRHALWPREGARLLSFFDGNEAARSAELLRALEAGEDVAVISEGGTPGVSDPGQRLVAAAAAAGVRVEPLPGPSAALCALVGRPEPTERFLFSGFPPRQEGARLALFGSLRREPGTLLFLEAPDRTGRTLGDLAQAFGAARPACVARELTKLHEEFARGTLGDLAGRYAEVAPRGEVTIVVGGAPAQDAEEGEEDVEAAVRERLRAGQGPKEIAAALSLRTGRPRRQLYQLALALQGRRDADDGDG